MVDFKLRKIKFDDAQTVFNWRNEPYIANLGTLKKTVTWEEHVNWLNNTLKETDRKAFILEIDKVPAGQVRFDRQAEEVCVISVYLIKQFWGKGYGIELIKKGCHEIFSEWKEVKSIQALVRRDNETGQKAFIKAGFIENEFLKDENHFCYVLGRSI